MPSTSSGRGPCAPKAILVFFLFTLLPLFLTAQPFTLVELNVENLFDCRHDSLKQDTEFLPGGVRHWTRTRYWRKLNHTAQTILSCSDLLPDLVALVEVENDTVLHDLTCRSLLRNADYHYLMTCSPDERGIDVALLYQPSSFRPLCYDAFTVPLQKGMRPTRDILYVKGLTVTADTLHVFVVHAPSRYGGEQASRPYRMEAATTLLSAVDSIFQLNAGARIMVAGDFNDPIDSHPLRLILHHGLVSATQHIRGVNGSPGNYRYDGRWQQIDYIFLSPSLHSSILSSFINDAPFLMEPDNKYGGLKPFRTYLGYRYRPGFSDHLPLVVTFNWSNK